VFIERLALIIRAQDVTYPKVSHSLPSAVEQSTKEPAIEIPATEC
jgi:hypothetical protein